MIINLLDFDVVMYSPNDVWSFHDGSGRYGLTGDSKPIEIFPKSGLCIRADKIVYDVGYIKSDKGKKYDLCKIEYKPPSQPIKDGEHFIVSLETAQSIKDAGGNTFNLLIPNTPVYETTHETILGYLNFRVL